MTKQYIHHWEDTDTRKLYIMEQNPVYGKEAAIEEYWQQKSDWSEYHHTLVIDNETKTCKRINIEQEYDLGND